MMLEWMSVVSSTAISAREPSAGAACFAPVGGKAQLAKVAQKTTATKLRMA